MGQELAGELIKALRDAPVTRVSSQRFLSRYPGTGLLDALGERVHAERGPVGVWQPVDGQAAGDVIDGGADPGDLRVVGVAVGHEELVEAGAEQDRA